MGSLIGKWVLVDSIMIGGTMESRPHMVTDVKGGRVYLSEAVSELKQGEWIFNGAVEPCGYRQKKSIKYAFDTFQNCLEAGAECRKLHWDWWTSAQDEMKSKSLEAIRILGGTKVS